MIFQASLGIGQLKDFPGMHCTVTRCSAITCFLLLLKCPFSLSTANPRAPANTEPRQRVFLQVFCLPPPHSHLSSNISSSERPPSTPKSMSPMVLQLRCFRELSRDLLSHTDAWVSCSEILIQLSQDATWAWAFLRIPQRC